MVGRFFVFDFDSTFVSVESMELLAEIALSGRPEREKVLRRIKEITDLGMEGYLPMEESLSRRISLLRAKRAHVAMLAERLLERVTPSFARNAAFLAEHAQDIYILSAGFRESIVPVVERFGIHRSHVFANTLVFDANGCVVGVDKTNPLSKTGGKLAQLRALRLKGEVLALGDGYTDYELRAAGAASAFFAFTENVSRESVVALADHIAPSFEAFVAALDAR